MKQLTERQEEVFAFIKKFVSEHPSPPTFRELADHFGVSVRAAYDHIKALERKGFVRCDKNRSRSIELIQTGIDSENSAANFQEIPILGTVAAGLPILSNENFEGSIMFPQSMLKPGAYFALKVKGASMTGAGIFDGDTAIIKQQGSAENGTIVVAMVDEAVTLKRFIKEPNRVQLKAENPEFPSIFTRDVRILGVLAHVMRSYG